MSVRSAAKAIVAVSIEWEDASSEVGWWGSNEGKDTSLIPLHTVGWLVEEHKNRYVISHTISKGGGRNGYICIPKAWIKKIKKVKL